MTTRKPVFIEKIMPVKLLNEQVYYEHGGNPFKGLHRWYSRKPLSFSRASVLGSLLPGEVSIEEFEYLLGLNRRVAGMQDKTTKLYKTPPSPERIKKVQELCEQQWGTKTPVVLDAFAGGGSIPFEAARYGLKVLASDLNPVAVVTMKAAIEYPLKFGADLQQEIDKWVKWVGDEAEKRLEEFFPSLPNEKVQNYLWAHTVVCPNCESTVPLSPNWWLYKRPEKQNLNKWCAVRPIPNLEQKRVDFELVKGRKGKGNTIVGQASSLLPKEKNTIVGQASSLLPSQKETQFEKDNGGNRQDACPTEDWEYDPETQITISRAVGKCPNCDSVIENAVIMQAAKLGKLHQTLYAVAYKQGKGNLCFRVPSEEDLAGVTKAEELLSKKLNLHESSIPVGAIPEGKDLDEQIRVFCPTWKDMFNPRQLLTLVTYVEILNDVKAKLQIEYEPEKVEAIATYLALVLDRCVDMNCRLAHWDSSRAGSKTASAQHSINLMWNYPEVAGAGQLWHWCADAFASDYVNLCDLINSKPGSDSLISISVEQASCLSPSQQATGKMPVPQGLEFSEMKKSELQITYRGDLPHWTMNGALYFITFSTWEKQSLTPEAQKVVLDVCLFFNQQRYQIYALVVMPDHVHLLIQPLQKNEAEYWSLSSILHSIKSYSAKQIPKVMKHLGVVWQDSRYDRIVRDAEEFNATWEYIRQNPVKANLSDTPEAYAFFWQISESQFPVGQASCLSPNSKPSLSLEDQSTQLEEQVAQLEEQSVQQATGKMPVPQQEIQEIQIITASADSLTHISDSSVDAIVTDPPYYATIQYAELSDFFYVWQKRTLGDIFPELFWSDLTDKDREAVANPSRFRNMGISPEELANQDYEAKMALAFAEYHRVLRDDGVMTVQFNHKDSGAWDVLAKSLIDAGFEITASWSVSTENPQNLHQAQKNSVSSTVLLVCRKRDPDIGKAWWDDLRPQVANLVEQRAPEFEANEIDGIDLYLSAFGPALNIFSRHSPILDTSGNEVRPEEAFSEARKAVANYRFRKLAQTDTIGFDPLTTWYILAWDAFRAREFPFDEARQLALAVGGFNVSDLAKTHKLLDSTSGICKLLTPDQRFKKRAFSTNPEDFTLTSLIDGLHAVIAIYLEEQSIDPVRRFLKTTGLLSNNLFMRSWEVTLRVIPHIGDDRKRMPEEKALADLWLAMDEIKAKVRYEQPELDLGDVQQSLF